MRADKLLRSFSTAAASYPQRKCCSVSPPSFPLCSVSGFDKRINHCFLGSKLQCKEPRRKEMLIPRQILAEDRNNEERVSFKIIFEGLSENEGVRPSVSWEGEQTNQSHF